MVQRILERGKNSGREDDNIESIKKRFREPSLFLDRWVFSECCPRYTQGANATGG